MTNDVPWYVSLIVSFLPLALACGAIVWHGRQIRKSMTTRDGRSMAQVFDDLARELKRTNDLRGGSKP
jgi:Flp pilus assembly protein TadB